MRGNGNGHGQFTLIDSLERLKSLEAPWRELAQRARAIPFQWYEWHEAWLTTMGAAGRSRPHIVAMWEGERLVAVMPLAVRRARRMRLLEWSAADVTDYCDALIDPELERKFALAKMWHFVKSHGGFDIARLSNLRDDATAAQLVNGGSHTLSETTRFTLTVTWKNSSAWLKSLSSKARQDIGRRMRRLHDNGVTFRICAAIDPWEPTLEALIEQKRAISKQKGYRSILDAVGGPEFLRKITSVLHERRVLQLSSLRNRSRFTACHIGFSANGVFYSYLTSYDPALPDHSPGQTLLAQVVMWCCDNKVREIDFMTGGDEHKIHLGCRQDKLYSFVNAKTLVGEAALMAYRLSRARHRLKQPSTSVKAGMIAAGAEALSEATNVAATTWVSVSTLMPPPGSTF
jgi:CelD/BcsL family acetyltransferase involved in cellulose biosynthesis